MNNFTEGDTLTLVRLPVIDFVGLKYYFENMVDANISLEKLYNQYLGYRKQLFN